MKHVYYECEDPDCNGSCVRCCLAHCKVCNLAEGELTTDCYGRKVHRETAKQVYAGLKDFKDGGWVTKEGC